MLAYDEDTGGQAYKKVVRLFRNESREWTGITVCGAEIISTRGHKYYLPEAKKWEAAENLKAGEKVLLSSGECGIIEAAREIYYDEPETTYNFEVEDFHTYYVGEHCVLVHNTCKNAAMREAKRSENIPMSQSPDKVIAEPSVLGADGKYYQPKTYVYGNKFIRNDFGGHLFRDGTVLSGHYNAGQIVNGRFIGNGLHFFY